MKKVFLSIWSFFLLLPLMAQQDGFPAPSSFQVDGVVFRMVRVEKGHFWMGAQNLDTADFNYDRQAKSDEMPVHYVNFDADFYIGQTEVTQALWQAVMGYNPSKKRGKKRPVENVCWNEVQLFLYRLDSLTGMPFRLPTEAEWEYAARGGRYGQGHIYSGSDEAERVAWYRDNTRKTKETGKLQANELDLYDMSGNVWEWCSTPYRFYNNERNASISKDPLMYVIRGGAWQLPKSSSRVSWRGKRMPDAKNSFGGLRLALDAKYVEETSAEDAKPESYIEKQKE